MTTPDDAREFGEIGAKLDTLQTSVDRISRALFGNGEPGVIGRVDRLEQERKRVIGAIKWIVAAAIGIAGVVVAVWKG